MSEEGPKPKRRRLLLIIGAVVAGCMVVVILAYLFGSPDTDTTPTQAVAELPTSTGEDIGGQPDTPSPGDTPLPTERPTATEQPTRIPPPADTRAPTNLPAPTATQRPTRTAAPTNTRLPADAPTSVPSAEPTQPPPSSVFVASVFNDGYAEHVVIRNRGDSPADLSGWRLAESDDIVEPFVFPAGYTLGPGAEVRIYSGRDGREHNPPASFDWTEKNVWDNDGERARLFDGAGNLVSEYRC